MAYSLIKVKDMPDVGVVIVNYDAGSILSECVNSIVGQVEQIVVVDNASQDDSLSTMYRNLPNNARVKVVVNTKNLGFAAACNIGAEVLTNDILLFLNPDCILEADTVQKLSRALLDDAKVGMVGGLLLNTDGTEQAGGRRAVPTPWRSFVRAFGLARLAKRWPRLFFDFYLHKQPLPTSAVEVEAISGACMMVKQKAIANVGFWDEGYFLHCEDLDWCMRFRQCGWKVMFVPSARLVHVHGVSSRNRRIFVEWHKHKGMMRFYRKFFRHQYPGILMWLVSFGVWLRFGLVLVALSGSRLLKGVGLARG